MIITTATAVTTTVIIITTIITVATIITCYDDTTYLEQLSQGFHELEFHGGG